MVIYILTFKDIKWGNRENLLTEYISPSRYEKIKKYKHLEDRLLSLYGELIVRMGIQKTLLCDSKEICFSIGQCGKPFLLKNNNIHFNISHTRNALICGISNKKIGVDVEKNSVRDFEALMKKCFHDEEITYLNNLPQESFERAFYKIWTCKEAYAKHDGRGLHIDFKDFSVISSIILNRFMLVELENYIFSVYSHKSYDKVGIIELTCDNVFKFFCSKKSII